jgi:hypothetical protein
MPQSRPTYGVVAEGPEWVYFVKKLGQVDCWTKILSGSTYQNRRYSTIGKRMNV